LEPHATRPGAGRIPGVAEGRFASWPQRRAECRRVISALTTLQDRVRQAGRAATPRRHAGASSVSPPGSGRQRPPHVPGQDGCPKGRPRSRAPRWPRTGLGRLARRRRSSAVVASATRDRGGRRRDPNPRAGRIRRWPPAAAPPHSQSWRSDGVLRLWRADSDAPKGSARTPGTPPQSPNRDARARVFPDSGAWRQRLGAAAGMRALRRPIPDGQCPAVAPRCRHPAGAPGRWPLAKVPRRWRCDAAPAAVPGGSSPRRRLRDRDVRTVAPHYCAQTVALRRRRLRSGARR
jgi:hypothetical protein